MLAASGRFNIVTARHVICFDQLRDGPLDRERDGRIGPAGATDAEAVLFLGVEVEENAASEEAVAAFGEAISQGHLPSDVLVSRAEVQREMGEQEGYSRDLAAAAALYPFNPRVVERVMAGYVEV